MRVTAPPFHPRCRCAAVPWYEEIEEKELAKDRAAYNQTPDWGETQPINHTKEERENIEKYANSKNLNIYKISAFDGDTKILKEQIDVISDTLRQYNITDKVTLSFSGSMEDEDFAETVNNTITFNTKVLRNREITNRILNGDNWLASDDIRGIGIHEVGHLICKKYGNKGVEIAKEAYYNIYKEETTVSTLLSYLKKNVSEYSAKINAKYMGKPKKNKYYKELLPEILAKNTTSSDEFTSEFCRLIKEEFL